MGHYLVTHTLSPSISSPGAGGVITITAQVNPSLRCCGTFTNSARISTDAPDPDPTNNFSSASNTVVYCLYLPVVMRNNS